MLITNKVENGQKKRNAFVAYDDYGKLIGKAQISQMLIPEISPQTPLEIRLSIRSGQESMLNLCSASLARGLELAAKHPEYKARLCAEYDPRDRYITQTLHELGFSEEDSVIRMTKKVSHLPVGRHLPEGCIFHTDRLESDAEQEYFMQRSSRLFGSQNPQAWLKNARRMDNFKRLMLINGDGLAGELVCWTNGKSGIIARVYTNPDCRMQGVASYLMEMARLYFAHCSASVMIYDLRASMKPAAALAYSLGFLKTDVLENMLILNI